MENVQSVAPSSKRTIPILVLALIILGFGVRFWSIDYGFPFIYHMEEPFYTDAAWHLVCESNLDSSLLQLHTYLYALSITTDNIATNNSVCAQGADNIPRQVYALGRMVSVLLGTATIFVAYKLGKSFYGEPVGVLSALFIALNFLHVRESQHGTPDISGVFLVSLSILSYLPLSKPNAPRWRYILAGIITILAINARLTSFFLLPIAVIMHLNAHDFFHKRDGKTLLRAILDPRVPLTVATMIIVFMIINPQFWVNPVGFLRYWRTFFTLGGAGGFGRLKVDPLPAPLYYIRAIQWGAGILLAGLSALGIVWAAYRRKIGDVSLLIFIIPYFLLASISSVYFARYIIPIIPLLGILAARFLWEIVPKKRQVVWASLITLIVLIQPVQSVTRYEYLQKQTDTRTIAYNWLEGNIPEGAKVATEWHVVIDTQKFNVTVVDFYGLSTKPLDDYFKEGYDYVIVSSFIKDAIMLTPKEEQDKLTFYSELSEKADLIQEFKPYSGDTAPPYNIDMVLGPITSMNELDRPGPTIQVYKLRR